MIADLRPDHVRATDQKLRIMLIEDEAILAMDLSHSLTELGYQICSVARTRAEAIHSAVLTRPDLIICDVILADASCGERAVDDILGQIGPRPVIFITSGPIVAREGPFRHVSKPFMIEDIDMAICQLI
ncbi:MAG: response regulator [Pseudomonadota bacterium]